MTYLETASTSKGNVASAGAGMWRGVLAVLLLWTVSCALLLVLLSRWHRRERAVLKAQASTLVHAVADTLRVVGRRVKESDGLLDAVFSEMARASELSGVALVDASGDCIAQANFGATYLFRDVTSTSGSYYAAAGGFIAVWDTVDLGECAGAGWGRGYGRRMRAAQGGGSGAGMGGQERFRLFVSVPLTGLRQRWRRDWVVVSVLCGALLALGLSGQYALRLYRRSTAYGEALQRATEERRALEAINLVAAGVAHEIKNPLGVVRGVIQRLASGSAASAEIVEAYAVVAEEIDRTTSRINELLSFANPREPILEAVSVHQAVARLERLMSDELEDAGVTLEVAGPDLEVQADPEQFRQVLFNLLHNAMRFAPGTTTVTVRTETQRRFWSLAIEDQGPGVPEALLEKVFAPYYTTAPDGSGLGLAVVRRIVRAHGWDIGCRRGTGGGAVFEIRGYGDDANRKDKGSSP